jgi:hypothetical protein
MVNLEGVVGWVDSRYRGDLINTIVKRLDLQMATIENARGENVKSAS